jgi:hypothetical protein
MSADTTADIRPLDPRQRDRFAAEWESVEARFVDEPGVAVSQADILVQQVMEARGYPVRDFEERAADLAVEHADVVRNYRTARRVAHRNRRGDVTPEDLRMALISYRALFTELLGADRS